MLAVCTLRSDDDFAGVLVDLDGVLAVSTLRSDDALVGVLAALLLLLLVLPLRGGRTGDGFSLGTTGGCAGAAAGRRVGLAAIAGAVFFCFTRKISASAFFFFASFCAAAPVLASAAALRSRRRRARRFALDSGVYGFASANAVVAAGVGDGSSRHCGPIPAPMTPTLSPNPTGSNTNPECS